MKLEREWIKKTEQGKSREDLGESIAMERKIRCRNAMKERE